jgi:hypothetical protein
MADSFLNSKLIVLASCLQKTCGFARNWPLALAKFAAVFLMDFKVLHPPGGSFEKSSLKVHKNENFFGSDFEICTFSLIVSHKD